METVKIVQYKNRKLYDTKQKCYVNLSEIADTLKQGNNVIVVDHTTKADITRKVLVSVYSNELSNNEVSIDTISEAIRLPRDFRMPTEHCDLEE